MRISPSPKVNAICEDNNHRKRAFLITAFIQGCSAINACMSSGNGA